jgi:hypothetical protein
MPWVRVIMLTAEINANELHQIKWPRCMTLIITPTADLSRPSRTRSILMAF